MDWKRFFSSIAVISMVLAAVLYGGAVLRRNQVKVNINAARYAAARSGVNDLVGGTEEMEDEGTGESEDTVSSEEYPGEDVKDDTASGADSVEEITGDTLSSAESSGDYDAETMTPDRPEEIAEIPGMTNTADSAAESVEQIPAENDATDSAAESIEEIPAAADGGQVVRLGFAGDINFDESWPTTQYLDREGGIDAVFSSNLFDLMRGFDIFMVNNEFTYSTRGEPVDKTYHFRANPSRVSYLDTIGADIVLLANNHVFDYGEDALLDTLDTLDEAGIPYVGAGRNLEEARRPYYFTVNGRKIAYVAASSAEEYTPSIATRAATENESGILACYDPELFLQTISEAAAEADYVVASVHWGMEYDSEYYDNQRELAERMIAAGADAIIGTHTHCLQGINFIDGKPVFYSLGNFWFNEKDLYTGLAELAINVPSDPEQPVTLSSARFYPCTQYDLYTEMPDDENSKAVILEHLESISHGYVEIDSEGCIVPAS